MAQAIISDGLIETGSEAADLLGFTADKFHGWLWKAGDAIYISLVVSLKPGQRHFSNLVDNILAQGYTVKVPNPLGKMRDILLRKGFSQSVESDDTTGGAYEVWYKRPTNTESRE
jgi:hypothetical protein